MLEPTRIRIWISAVLMRRPVSLLEMAAVLDLCRRRGWPPETAATAAMFLAR